MAYAGKHTWATGDTITAANLNNIEDGIEEQVNALNTHFPATGKLVVGTGSATADYAVAVGHNTQANAPAAHAEGYMTKATGDRAHSEGVSTTASGWVSHAEGSGTIASGDSSHAENSHTIASGNASHTEGANTQASGHYSHAEGYYTRATHKAQHVFGEFNVLDDSSSTASNRGNYVEIVGNGTGASARSNARTLDWSGNETLAGRLEVGSGVQLKTTYIANNVGNEPRTLVFNDCDKIELWYEEDLGEVIAEHEASISLAELNNLLSMLQYYQSITPFTAAEMTRLRALIATEPTVPDEEPAVEDPAYTVTNGVIESGNTATHSVNRTYGIRANNNVSSVTITSANYANDTITYKIDNGSIQTLGSNRSIVVSISNSESHTILVYHNVENGASYTDTLSVYGYNVEEPVVEEPAIEEPVAEDP